MPKKKTILLYLWVVLLHALVPQAISAVLMQQQAGVFAFEAEDFESQSPASSWTLIGRQTGMKPLSATSDVKGTGAIMHTTTSNNVFMTYRLLFTYDGVYNLYTRYANMDMNGDAAYGNEDSFFLPDAFNMAASTSGNWHEQFVGTARSKEGETFAWDAANRMKTDASSNRVADGALTFTISGASVQNPVEVTFTVRGRENGMSLDQFVFTTSTYALTGDYNAALDVIQSVPEPSVSGLLLMGSGILLGCRRRA